MNLKQYQIQTDRDFIYAKGGDGTLLKAIKEYKRCNKPFFGIAGGTVNFLMNEDSKLHNNHKIIKFNLINVKVKYKRLERDLSSIYDHFVERETSFEVFNDVMIGGDMNSWIDFKVHDKDYIIGEFKGGGVIISSAQGSTGINKNNSGTILPLSSQNWVFTGDKTNRKVNYVIEPKKLHIIVESRNPVKIWGDGENYIFDNVQEIEITKGSIVEVVFNDYTDFKRKRRI